MGRLCKKCGNVIHRNAWINGKRRSLTQRKYCFDCSPFGTHNTVSLEVKEEVKDCKKCGSKFRTKRQLICPTCRYRMRRRKRGQKVYDIVGTACWKCGYDKGMAGVAVLEFHHVDPALKLFNVSMREIVGIKWERIWMEMQKCVLLCCRCHREIHANLIDQGEIHRIYEEEWDKRLNLATGKDEHKQPLPEIRCECGLLFIPYYEKQKYCCVACSDNGRRKVPLPSKDELYKLLWQLPTTKIAKRYGVSDKAVEKWAKGYDIDKPPRGYWSGRNG